jgi:phospholipase C
VFLRLFLTPLLSSRTQMQIKSRLWMLLVVGLTASSSYGQTWTIVTKASESAGPPPLKSLAIPATGSGNLIAVALIFNGTTSVASISDNAGNIYVSGGAKASVSNFATEIWYAVDSASGATAITPTFVGSPTHVEMTEWEVSGVSTSVPDASSIASGEVVSSNVAGPVVTTTVAGDFVLSVMYAGAVTFSGTSSGNEFTNDFTTNGRGWAHITSSSATAGTHQASWVTANTPAGRYCASTVAFRPVAVQSQASPFNHIIVIDQENRSLDNLLGSNSPSNQYYLPGLDVSTTAKVYTIVNGKKEVSTVAALPLPLASENGSAGSILADNYDPNHDHLGWTLQCDAPKSTDPSTQCAMDGFNQVAVACNPGATGCPGIAYPTVAYVQYQDVAPYFQIASQYGYANYFFQTNQGPSFPAHQFIFSGTSQPGNGPEPDWFVATDASGTSFNGCAAPSTGRVAVVNPATQDTKTVIFPCFDHATMADLFAAHVPPITWTYYNPGMGSLWTAPNAIDAICIVSGDTCTGPYWTKGATNGFIDLRPVDVLTDISKCKLQQVNWVIPSQLESDHSGTTDGSGPSWVSSIINDIGNSACTDVVNGRTVTYWQDTVILITWDDWGGWYEHVVPPPLSSSAPATASSNAYGFRVPFMVVSAYTPPGTVSNVMGMDFGTILKFIEQTFDLGNIPTGDLGAFADYYSYGDLSEFFRFGAAPRSFQSIAAPLKDDVFLDPKRLLGPPDND